MSQTPLFVLRSSLINAMGWPEVSETIKARLEAGMSCKLPFPSVTMSFRLGDFATNSKWCIPREVLKGAWLDNIVTATIRGFDITLCPGEGYGLMYHPIIQSPVLVEQCDGIWYNFDLHTGISDIYGIQKQEDLADPPKIIQEHTSMISNAVALLIVALSIKNVERQTRVNNRAERGKGSAEFRDRNGVIYTSRTILDLPTEFTGNGRTMPPHMRRGHNSHFWIGALDSPDRKRIVKYIDPIFVNEADALEIPPPKTYKVG